MPDVKIVKCQPISPEMKKYCGEEINLTHSKAKRLENAGKVRILGDIKKKNNKYIEAPRKKRIFKRVEMGEPSGIRIPTIIPYASNKKIGIVYNDAMKNIDDWVIFVDHDVWLATNPLWHEISVNAIMQIGHKAGWITCYTNRIGCKFQKAPRIDTRSDDIRYHRDYALNLYNKNKGKIKDFTKARGGRFSGMFILTHKQAWLDAGGFSENMGFFGVDCNYYTKLKRAGYGLYLMQDLYVYHGYFREALNPLFKKEVI